MGEASRLALITMLDLQRGPFEPLRLAHALAGAQYLMPSPSLKRLTHNLTRTNEWDRLGGTSASCAGLRRIAPMLLAHCGNPQSHLWSEVAVSTALTHNDCAALVGTLGYVYLLWELLAADRAPKPTWYYETFMQATEGLETGTRYEGQTHRFRSWRGSLRQFLAHAYPDARAKGLDMPQVVRGWGSGPFMLEFMPTLLYVLEHYADDPTEALRRATTDTVEADSLGAAVGAALGALHGPQPEWKLEKELEEALKGVQGRNPWGTIQ
jgi:ADP-ribosylglycohydrolase